MEDRTDYTPEPYVAPSTPTERLMARLWEEVLDVQPIGAADSFIELGGASFGAVWLSAQLKEHFACELPVRVILASNSLSQLSRLVTAPGAEPT